MTKTEKKTIKELNYVTQTRITKQSIEIKLKNTRNNKGGKRTTAKE